jgi:hypothetical protein
MIEQGMGNIMVEFDVRFDPQHMQTQNAALSKQQEFSAKL